MDAIATEALTKSYGRARGIAEVDLSVPPGTIFGFLGPNGAGRTTTLRALVDFLRSTWGAARVLGLDTRRDSVELHRRVGELPRDPALYDRIIARELLRRLGRLRGGLDRVYVEQLVERECGLGRPEAPHPLPRTRPGQRPQARPRGSSEWASAAATSPTSSASRTSAFSNCLRGDRPPNVEG